MHPLDQDTSTIPLLVTYQPDLFRKHTKKKFVVEFKDRVERFDTFAAAHARAQRLKRMGVAAKVSADEV